MSEHAIQNTVRNALVGQCVAFRANVGQAWTGSETIKITWRGAVQVEPGDVVIRKGRPFSTGLPVGFSDLFGLVPVTITQDMVGQKFARFLAVEIKQPGKNPTDKQAAFLEAMQRHGALAGVARSADDALAILQR